MMMMQGAGGGSGRSPFVMNRRPSSSDDDDYPNYPGHGPPQLVSESESDDDDEEEEEDDDIPDIHDFIPWAPNPNQNPPPLVDVTEHVRTAEGINEIFLRNALRSHYAKDGTLREVTVESFTEAPMLTPDASQKNLLTEVNVNAVVEGKPETLNLVIKTLTPVDQVRKLASKFLYDKREIALLTKISSDITVFQQQQMPDANEYLSVPSVKCLFLRYKALSDEQEAEEAQMVISPESVVVMENVKYQGFTQTLITEGLSREQVLSAIECMCRYQGISLAMKERSGIPLERSYQFLICMKRAAPCVVKLFDRNVYDVLRRINKIGAKSVCLKVMDLRPHLELLIYTLSQTAERLTVLTHLNLWAHNMLFKGNECVFVDWQMVTCARPTLDMAFLMASSVKPQIRRTYKMMFLEHYYTHFSSYALRYGLDIESVMDFDMDDLAKDYRYSQLLALIFCIARADDILKTDESIADFLDFINELDEQNIINLEILRLATPEIDMTQPFEQERLSEILSCQSEAPKDELDKIYSMFPAEDPPEE